MLALLRARVGPLVDRLLGRPDDYHSVWKRGERRARRYLERRGYRTVGINIRTPRGEADIVMLAPDRRTVVVVEVKSRAGETGPQRRPEASITEDKQRRLRAIAGVLAKRKIWRDRVIRIDVVAVELHGRKTVVRHFPNAV